MKSVQITMCRFFATISAVLVIILCQEPPVINGSIASRSSDTPIAFLPKNVTPLSYNITLKVQPGVSNFHGESTITIVITKETNILTMHAKNLKIYPSVKLTIDSGNKTIFGIVNPSVIDEENDFLEIIFVESLKTDKYFLHLTYSGVIGDEMIGLYQNSRVDNSGEKEWLIATQLKPTGARRVFPCWDEPGIRAFFELSITTDKKYTVLSNTHEEGSSTDLTDVTLKTTRFAKTPQMPVHQVAFILGKFDVERSKTHTGLHLAAPRAIIHLGLDALNFTERALDQLGNTTNIEYDAQMGIEKLDLVLVPLSAKMENWGLISQEESDFLEDKSSAVAEERIFKALVYKLTKQWFGNLVSCQSWNYLWINEGFAEYFKYLITNKLEPSWRVMDKMVVKNIQGGAFKTDGEGANQPISIDVNTPSDVTSIFEAVNRDRNGAIFRMMFHVLGPVSFENMTRIYLSSNRNKVISVKELVEAVKTVTDMENLKDVLTNWITTPGLPVVNVLRNYTTNKLEISQSRFLYKKDDNEKTYYYVPINYVSEDELNFDDTKAMRLLPASNKPLVIEDLPKDKFVLFNKQQFGYYRVNYDNETWKLITNFMIKNSSKIHVLNRAQLIDDSFNLARAGQLDYSVPLSLAKYLKEETDYIPWISAMNAASYLDRVLTKSTSSREFKNFVVELMDKMVKSVGFEEKADDDHVTLDKRATAVRWACAFGSKSCLDYAKEKFDKWMADPKKNPLSADLRETILCSGLRKANETTWTNFLTKYQSEKNENLLPILGCTLNTSIIHFYLNSSLNASSGINVNEALKSVYSNSNEGMKIALEVLTANYSQIVTLTGGDKNAVGDHISAIASRMTTEAELTPLKEFIKKNEKDLAVEIIAKGVAVAEDNINWVKTHDEQFVKLFKKETPQTSTTAPTTMKPGSAAAFTVSTLAILTSLIISLL